MGVLVGGGGGGGGGGKGEKLVEVGVFIKAFFPHEMQLLRHSP